ncbi:unnamed protein product [Heligmosomoides polygyrus]|uniref:RanBP2-type domain-containing protein n=1 Tax=Heligmosomoides polygyrus TaxID=6339 RepID=A0A183FYG4_HELPZ|nr:unnamed protein product [Heligmosomoides polygyrus]
MSSWPCQYCTLVNSDSRTLCAACGSERDSSKRPSLFPRIVMKPSNGPTANAVPRQQSPAVPGNRWSSLSALLLLPLDNRYF